MESTPLERICAYRAGVEELLMALKADDGDMVTLWAESIAEALDEEMAEYGEEGREIYAHIRRGITHLKWREIFEGREN